MKKSNTARLAAGLSLMALAGVPTFGATLSVSSGFTPQQLVDYLVPAGGGITVSPGSATVTWGNQVFTSGTMVTGAGASTASSANSIGEFNNATVANGLTMSNGVLLSTGWLADSLGPNNDNFKSGATRPNTEAAGGSAALEGIIPLAGGTRDAITLTFKFKSDFKNFLFQYAFASEEYTEFSTPEWADVNDAFAFILSGPGLPSGGQNLAVVPFTTDPVSVQTINQSNNSLYYLDNTPPGSPYNIQFDGIAGGAGMLPLFAFGTVTPGAEYTISLVIADVPGGDRRGDSAVFVGENSFHSPPPTVPEPSTYVGALALAGLVARRLRRKA